MVERRGEQPDQPADDGAARDRGGWLRPALITALLALPLVVAAGGVRLGCEAGVLDLPVCGNAEAAVSAAVADLEIEGGTTTLTVTDPGGAPLATIQEPAALFPGQFLKFVVTAPDNSRVLYVTATSLGMTDTTLWIVPRGGAKALLTAPGDDFWVARPAWCQRGPGDPGRIGYVRRGPTGPDRTGLELWTINADGSDERRVLIGTPQNGFGPDLFYGGRPSPLRFYAGCDRLAYQPEGGERHLADLRDGRVTTPVTALPLPGAPAPTPVAGVAAPATQPCYLKPFAQTDPRWGQDRMQRENTAIRSWGCALTSTAMLFHYYGVDTDPGRLNRCAGDQADLLYWDPVRQRCAGDRVTATRWSGAASWDELAQALAAGRPVIVGLQGGPAGSHFLVVTGGSGDVAANYQITDSWDGSSYKTLADYINPKKGYVLRWLVVFQGQPGPCQPNLGAADATGITVSSPQDGGVYNAPQPVRYTVTAPAGAVVEASHRDGETVAAEGAHTVTVTVQQGGQVTRKRVSFLIDRTPPVVEARWQPATADSIVLAVTASDALTEVTEAYYRVDEGEWRPVNEANAEWVGLALRPVTVGGLALGPHTLRYYAVDSAGNKSAEQTLAIVVAPPDVAVAIDGAPAPVRAAIPVSFPPDIGGRTLTIGNDSQQPVEVKVERKQPKQWLKVKKKAKAQRTATPKPPAPPKKRTKDRRPAKKSAVVVIPPAAVTDGALVTTENGLVLRLLRFQATDATATPGPVATPVVAPAAGATTLPPETLLETLAGQEELELELELDEDELFDDVQTEEITLTLTKIGAGQPPLVLTLVVSAQGALLPAELPATPTPAPTSTPTAAGVTVSDANLVVRATETSTAFSLKAVNGGAVAWALAGGEDLPWLKLSARAGELPADGAPVEVRVEVDRGMLGATAPPPVTLRLLSGGAPSGEITITVEAAATPTPTETPLPTVTPTATPLPRPVIRRLSPSSIVAGSGDFTLTVEGTDFQPGAIVRWKGAERPTTFVSATQLTAAIRASDVSTPGQVEVDVINPDGQDSRNATFTVTAPNTPTPTFTPQPPTATFTATPCPPPYVRDATHVQAGTTGAAVIFVLQVLGGHFDDTTTVFYDGKQRQTKFVNAETLQAESLTEDRQPGGHTVYVVSRLCGKSNTFDLTIPYPTPRISALSGGGLSNDGGIYYGATSSRGFTLTVTGSGFTRDSKVYWDGAARTTTFVSSSTLTVALPGSNTSKAGRHSVTVVNPSPGGGTSNAITVILSIPS
jgi:hypothetical protein